MIHQLVNSGLLEKADVSSLAIVNSGAAYLPPKVSDAMQKLIRSARLQEGTIYITQAEMSKLITLAQATVSQNVCVHPIRYLSCYLKAISIQTFSSLRRPAPGSLGGLQPIRNSTGILLPDQLARLVRDDGTDAAIGEPGELWIGGNSVTLGYFNNEKATKECFVNGWLRTGDRFKTDGKGTFLYVEIGSL